jgi:hypothetical protein
VNFHERFLFHFAACAIPLLCSMARRDERLHSFFGLYSPILKRPPISQCWNTLNLGFPPRHDIAKPGLLRVGDVARGQHAGERAEPDFDRVDSRGRPFRSA